MSILGSAWKLEGEEEDVPVHGSTEGTPFVTSGLYFANSVKPIQSPSPHHRKLPSLNLNPQKLPSSKSVSVLVNTVYTRVQVEHVYKSNPIFEAKNTTFLEKV